MKVILTNNQLNTLMESLGSRFTISEVRVTFMGKRLNEDANKNDYTPPHRLMAIYLGNRKISPYSLANKYDRFDQTDPKNPYNNVPCAGTSYYFRAEFTVDGKPATGMIRISDHPAAPETFAQRGCDYGISIVFDNGSVRVGKHNSVEATVYEYIKTGKTDVTYIKDLTTKFLQAGGLIKIEGDHVVQPGGIDFKRITKSSDKKAAREISLITTDDLENDSALFMSPPDIGIHLIAQKDRRGNYHISKDDMKKFNFGDVIKFYYYDGTPIGRPLTIDV